MDEAPGRAFARIGQLVDDAIEDHEERCHIPPPRRGRVTSIPFPDVTLDDSQVCRAWEMMKLGASLEEAALALGVPDLVLVRCLHDYQPAWQQFLQERSQGIV